MDLTMKETLNQNKNMKLLTKQIYEIYCLDNFDFDMIFTFCEVVLEKNGIYVSEGGLDFMNEKGMSIKDIDDNLKLILNN